MKASELVAALQAAIAEHGDLDVMKYEPGFDEGYPDTGHHEIWGPRVAKLDYGNQYYTPPADGGRPIFQV